MTPCVDLPTGVQKTVEWTPGVRDRIYLYGYYDLVDGPTEDEPSTYSEAAYFAADDGPVEVVPFVPVEEEPDPVVVVHDHQPGEDVDAGPPPRNGSRVVWAEFLSARGIGFVDDDGRDDLVDLWDKASGVG